MRKSIFDAETPSERKRTSPINKVTRHGMCLCSRDSTRQTAASEIDVSHHGRSCSSCCTLCDDLAERIRMLASLHAQVREIGQVGSPASFGPLEAWGLLAELNSAHKAFSACY